MVSEHALSSDGGGRDQIAASPNSYSNIFTELFPYYLSIGMTEYQYWDADCALAVAYRKAEELRINRRNQEMWLQGLYIYGAIGKLTPILHAFAKSGSKAEPYFEDPIPLNDKQAEEQKEAKERRKYLKGLEMMRKLSKKSSETKE